MLNLTANIQKSTNNLLIMKKISTNQQSFCPICKRLHVVFSTICSMKIIDFNSIMCKFEGNFR